MNDHMNDHKNLLVVAAHPDDELLGVGGTVARYVSEGWEAFCVILGQGALARQGTFQGDVARLKDCAVRAGEIIGYKEVLFESFPDNAFDTVSLLSIIKTVEVHFARRKPSLVFTHYAHDLNIDHRRTFQAVLTAARPCNQNVPAELLCFETLSASEWQAPDLRFRPNTYINVTSFFERKMKALAAYETEMRPFPHPRSAQAVTALSALRGSESSCVRAEAFVSVRRINF
jgi:LmbE family N-acetylglucosaminyl deacetylase